MSNVNPSPTQPRYSPDRLWFWNGFEWRPTPRTVPGRPMPLAARVALVAVGVVLAAGVELFAWVYPEAVRQFVRDPHLSDQSGAVIAIWLLVALAAGGAVAANWIVWLGSRAWTPERRS